MMLNYVKLVFFAGVLIFSASVARAEITATPQPYMDRKDHMMGVVVADPTWTGERPLVVMFPDWMGPSSETEQEARRIAALGYKVFIADMYGVGIRPTIVEEASNLSGFYKSKRSAMLFRAQAALENARALPGVKKSSVATIGYCFGGTVGLELALSGADVTGTVSVHGGLDSPNLNKAGDIKGRVLILHGADDPFVPETEIGALENEFKTGKVKYELVKYLGAVHAFTNEGADKLNLKGAAYNADADKQAFAAMEKFLGELFAVK